MAAAVGGVLFVLQVPSAAGQAARGFQDDSGISAGAGDPGTGPVGEPVSTGHLRGRGGGGSTRPTCLAWDKSVGPMSYRPISPDRLIPMERDTVIQDGGGFYRKYCGDELELRTDSRLSGTYFPARAQGSPPPSPDPLQLAVEALERTPLPEPEITMAPSSDIPQLVNLPTFLWLPEEQWESRSVSASAGGVTSTVTAMPTRVVWDMGQGDEVVCEGPGRPYVPDLPDDRQPSDCDFTYPASSAGEPGQAFTVTATVQWETTWTVEGAAGGGSLGLATTSSATAVRVAELQSLNVGAPE